MSATIVYKTFPSTYFSTDDFATTQITNWEDLQNLQVGFVISRSQVQILSPAWLTRRNTGSGICEFALLVVLSNYTSLV
jgi:hypothetical protein